MTSKDIPESAIELVVKHINDRNNKSYSIPVIGNPDNPETPQFFEIIAFDEIDRSERRFLSHWRQLQQPTVLQWLVNRYFHGCSSLLLQGKTIEDERPRQPWRFWVRRIIPTTS